jgi:hypothetical protein
MVIAEILETHLEELADLWMRRQAAADSPDYVTHDVVELDRRIEAHLDGLLLHGDAIVPLLEAGIAGDDPAMVFAACLVLLELHTEDAARSVIESLLEAEAESLDAIGRALCEGKIDLVRQSLQQAVESAPLATCVTAAEALAFHGLLDPGCQRWREGLANDSEDVRRAAWRVVALVGS